VKKLKIKQELVGTHLKFELERIKGRIEITRSRRDIQKNELHRVEEVLKILKDQNTETEKKKMIEEHLQLRDMLFMDYEENNMRIAQMEIEREKLQAKLRGKA
jgi:hypothetical protein